MTVAVIYARYSTDMQSAASIDDQVRLCRIRAEREGWTPGPVYADRATSGASALRAGYQKLLEDARKGRFQIVLAEALDRMSRDQEHVAGLFKQLSFAGVKLVTLAEGEISELHVGLKGTMNALFLKDLADKTRRGLRGRVEAGRSGGGNAYGYKVVRELDGRGEPVHGGRQVDEHQAGIVRRIFVAFVAGTSPKGIAKALNAEQIPGPTGHGWTPSTIHGNRKRGTGILNNELYVGRLVWNRLHYVKDPDTGKRISRLNPESHWVTTEVPALRIVDDALWQAVRRRQVELELPERSQKIRNALNTRHRARYLLSGLLQCGCCGAGFTLSGADRYACANHLNRGTCDNSRTVLRNAIEARVLAGLKDKLLAPDLIATFVREFQEEWNRNAAASERGRGARTAELADVERRLAQVMAAIEQGIVTPTTKARLQELEASRDRMAADLQLDKSARPVPLLHPQLAEVYRAKVARLEEALNQPDTRAEAATALRALIDAVVLTPGPKRGEVHAELHGELAALLHGATNKKTRTSDDVRVSLVAGAGFEPAAFRL